jgi:DNA-binding MarR family transcriptional regulator
MDRVDRISAQWQRERPEIDHDAMALIGRIARLSRHLGHAMDKTFTAHDLNAASFDVLATLRRSGAPYRLSPGALLASTMVTSGTMTHRIDRLEREGLVRRIGNPDDARSVLIELTADGLARIDAAVTDHTATQTRLTASLSAEEQAQMTALLRKLLSGVEPD